MLQKREQLQKVNISLNFDIYVYYHFKYLKFLKIWVFKIVPKNVWQLIILHFHNKNKFWFIAKSLWLHSKRHWWLNKLNHISLMWWTYWIGNQGAARTGMPVKAIIVVLTLQMFQRKTLICISLDYWN